MKEKIKSQIKAIQRTGKVNMCDSVGVALIARKLGFRELVDFVQTDNYVSFIFTGDESYLPEE
jgi:hypothetical protein